MHAFHYMFYGIILYKDCFYFFFGIITLLTPMIWDEFTLLIYGFKSDALPTFDLSELETISIIIMNISHT